MLHQPYYMIDFSASACWFEIRIRDRNFEEYRQLISKRENNMAISMYLSKEDSDGRIDELIQDFNSGFK